MLDINGRIRKNQNIKKIRARIGMILIGIAIILIGSLLHIPTAFQFFLPIAWVGGPFVFFVGLTVGFPPDARKIQDIRKEKEKKNLIKKIKHTAHLNAFLGIATLVLSSLLWQSASSIGLSILAGTGLVIGATLSAVALLLAAAFILRPQLILQNLTNAQITRFTTFTSRNKIILLTLTAFITVTTSLLWWFAASPIEAIGVPIIGTLAGGLPTLGLLISLLPVRASSPIIPTIPLSNVRPPGQTIFSHSPGFPLYPLASPSTQRDHFDSLWPLTPKKMHRRSTAVDSGAASDTLSPSAENKPMLILQ